MNGVVIVVAILASAAIGVIVDRNVINDDSSQAEQVCRFVVYTGDPLDLSIANQPGCDVVRQRFVRSAARRSQLPNPSKVGDCTALLARPANKHRKIGPLNAFAECPSVKIIVFNPH